ncbi:MAG: polysaccharide biosynthesis C-terminal domain-containing protein [Arachidicoccus sp.]|nr:polysaccharide biosynthesis C-terminal domain-containing protein [Arachidicoccus sp.]
MGIVRKQSTYSTLLTYIGFLIGALNTLWLLPHYVSQDAFGLTRLMIDFALFFSALSTLGSLNGLYKFNPFYRAYLPPDDNDLPFLTLLACLSGSILFIIASLIFKDFLARKFGNNSPLFVANYKLVIPFTVSYTCIMLLEAYCWIIKKTVISNFVKELFFRLTTTILILLYACHVISLERFFALFSLSYIPSIIILAYLIFTNNNIILCTKISSVTKRLYKRILVFISFHFSGMLIAILPNTIDGIFIAGLSANGLESLAVYSIPKYLIATLEVPQRSMMGISVALISEAWKNRDKNKIAELYRKTSLNLLVIGIVLFGLIYVNIDNLVRFLGKDYVLIKQICLIAGIAKIIDMGMGMNAQILSLSKYWRFDFYTSASFIIVNIILDIFLIKMYGPIGAAYAGAIALIFYNLIRFFYLWKFFKMQPFTSKSLLAVILGLVAFFATYFIPYLNNIFTDTVVRTIVFCLLYIPGVLFFRISEDINASYRILINKLFHRK